MKHTKGEWFVAIDNNVYSQHGDARIAIVEADFNISEQEAEANARLIAAAPDLLGALQSVREHMTAHIPEKMFDLVDNAIFKAKGQ